jgi:hypothetical protein
MGILVKNSSTELIYAGLEEEGKDVPVGVAVVAKVIFGVDVLRIGVDVVLAGGRTVVVLDPRDE